MKSENVTAKGNVKMGERNWTLSKKGEYFVLSTKGSSLKMKYFNLEDLLDDCRGRDFSFVIDGMRYVGKNKAGCWDMRTKKLA